VALAAATETDGAGGGGGPTTFVGVVTRIVGEEVVVLDEVELVAGAVVVCFAVVVLCNVVVASSEVSSTVAFVVVDRTAVELAIESADVPWSRTAVVVGSELVGSVTPEVDAAAALVVPLGTEVVGAAEEVLAAVVVDGPVASDFLSGLSTCRTPIRAMTSRPASATTICGASGRPPLPFFRRPRYR
jgi:hypothetical protein